MEKLWLFLGLLPLYHFEERLPLYLFYSLFFVFFYIPVFRLYDVLFSKMAYVRSLEKSRKKYLKDCPPPYPNGWVQLCRSEEVKKGEAKNFSACGEEFAVFRGENGKITVMSAACPHLGANLGHGKVIKNQIECPFHG